MEETLDKLMDSNLDEEIRLNALNSIISLCCDFNFIAIYEQEFIGLLDSPNDRIRFGAITILGQIKSEQAVEPLISMISNAKKGVLGDLGLILDSLYEIGDRRAIGPILELVRTDLDSSDMDGAMTALEILQYKGIVHVSDIADVKAHIYDLEIQSI